MKIVRKSSLDMISELPSNIIQTILMFLPLQDAVRTSILSREWRCQWEKLPHLVFDHTFNPNSLQEPSNILMKIYEILLLHQGPILKFILDIHNMRSCSEIDKIICFFSRNGIQEFKLRMPKGECHKMPSYIFSCLQLRHLYLRSCVFVAPQTFKGFSKLISLELWKVTLAPNVCISGCPLLESLKLQSTTTIDSFSMDAPLLKLCLVIGFINHVSFINTPLLAELSFDTYFEPLPGENIFDLIKLLRCVPLVEHLYLQYLSLKLLAVHNGPKKLPTVLNYLSYLELSGINFTNLEEFSCTLCLIRSSPNLRRLRIELCDDPSTNVEPILEYLEMQDYSDLSLDKLQEVQIERVSGLRPDLEFIKLLLAKSPELEKMHIEPTASKIDTSCTKMLIEFTRFRRASVKAEIIFPHLDLDQA